MQKLPLSSVNEIFARMTVVYGSDWLMKWEGIDGDAIKDQWATDLGGFVNRLDAIQHALDHLPVDRPPNSLQFRVICMNAPYEAPPADKIEAAPQLPGMPPVKADITRLNAAFERYKELRAEAKKKPKQWAYDLQEREKRGEPLTEWQRKKWRDVLAEVKLPGIVGDFPPIPRECLPPGMGGPQREHSEEQS